MAVYTWQFPTKLAKFGGAERDNIDVVEARHINELRGEVLGIENFLGLDLLTRSTLTEWDVSQSQFTTLKAKLDWLDTGLTSHRHDGLYVQLAGGSVIRSLTSGLGLAIRNLNDTTKPTFQIWDASSNPTITMNGQNGRMAAIGATFTNTSAQGSTQVVRIVGAGSGNLLELVGSTGISSAFTANGTLTVGTAQAVKVSPVAPYLQLPVSNNNEIAVQISGADGVTGTYLKGTSADNYVNLATDSSLSLYRTNQQILLGTATGVVTVRNVNSSQRLQFSSLESDVSSEIISTSYNSTAAHGGDLEIKARSLTTAASTRLNGGFNPVRYKGLYNPGHTRTNPIAQAWVREGAYQVNYRSGRWYPLHDYTGDGDPQIESKTSPLFVPNYYPMKFIAPPSGEMTMHMAVELFGMNCVTGVGFTLVRSDGVSDAATQAFATPDYPRAVWYRSIGQTDGPVSESIPSQSVKNAMTLSNIFLLYWLTPGVEYQVRFHGAFLTFTSGGVHNWNRIGNLRVHLVPVLGA